MISFPAGISVDSFAVYYQAMDLDNQIRLQGASSPLDPKTTHEGGVFLRKRNVQVIVRLSEQEARHLNIQLNKSGLSRSTYLRFLIMGYAPKPLPPLDYHNMIKELRAIGTRMNQIAARANATGFIKADEYARDVANLHQAVRNIQDAMILTERRTADGGHEHLESG